jgi:hypothetical protein
MFVIDVIVAGVMLAVLRDPIAVFVSFAIVTAASVVLVRGKCLAE